MPAENWIRPEQPAIPTVWHRFQAKDLSGGDQLVTYRVEDLTEDRYEDAIQHYLNHFIKDEPLCRQRKMAQDTVSYGEIQGFWRWCFSRRMTIVCYREGSNEIVGANLLDVVTPVKSPTELKSQHIRDIVGLMDYVGEQCNVFEKYGVDRYMTAYGLAIDSRYRGRGIATEMLKARVPMCKALGISLTSTNFTAIGSQLAAAKAGFQLDYEKTYDDFAKLGPSYDFRGIESKSLQLMSLKIV
ncbi:uncharacterized protein LOC129738858 [Uranotaenia lowii]|uniref:uncharacterized protein LOC129738858 n=1 Tax=Uranotaenia lowii TaxID=190385 RepID=UPI0024786482|nr:uncharacterized protein LOC129738858 [Uranotaenia lowii]